VTKKDWSPRLSACLTLSEASFPVLDGSQRVGIVVRSTTNIYVASTSQGKIGEYVTALEAQRAVLDAHRAKKRRRS
jgi:hypothetical protein